MPKHSDDPILHQLTKLKIQIEPDQLTLVKRKRAEALALGLLNSSADDFVDAIIQIDSSEHAAQIRLKGDWLDHLKGNKWSWRIKLAEGNAQLGLQQFSLQHPRTRSYLDEWVFHQLMEQEGILTPLYTFVQVWLNNDYKGIYALEEHFVETLPERQERIATPILKFEEDGFWQTQAYRLQYGKNITPFLPDYEAADIAPFQKGKTAKDALLYAQFQAGRALLEQYRLKPESAPSQYLNADLWARFYALIDLAEAYHCLRWHNLRFYFNPVTSLLEPIAYDAYSENGVYRWFKKPFIGYYGEKRDKVYFRDEFLTFALFNDLAFRESYYSYLQKYTQDDFILDFFERIQPQIDFFESVLQTEFSPYEYASKGYYDQAANLISATLDYDQDHPPFVDTIYGPMYEQCSLPVPLPSISLKAYPAIDSSHIFLQNYYCQPITIQATGPNRKKPLHILKEPLTLEAFDIYQSPPKAHELTWPPDDRYVYYSVPDIDYWYRQRISHWLTPQSIDFLPINRLEIDTSAFSINGEQITLKAGHHSLHHLQIIPGNYQLLIEAGTQLDLLDGAVIFAFGEVMMEGTPQQPILIESTDHSGRGCHFIASQSLQSVQLSNVHFRNLASYQDHGRWLNGAVSAYECKFVCQNCRFENSRAEDALNIVRSEVILEDLQFLNCPSDGLDIDFSLGSLTNGHFKNIGGDALDLSGSDFRVTHLQFDQIADKGISAGEGTFLEGSGLSGKNLNIGVAAKDHAQVILDEVYFTDCDYGLVAFAKKPVYLPANLTVTHYQNDKGCTYPFAVEEGGHQLIINSKQCTATHKAGELKALFYSPK